MNQISSKNLIKLIAYLSDIGGNVKTYAAYTKIDKRRLLVGGTYEETLTSFISELRRQSSDNSPKIVNFLEYLLDDAYENSQLIIDCLDDLITPIKNGNYLPITNDTTFKYEKILGPVSNINDAVFLDKGVICKKSVGKVIVKSGYGTGFLLKNNHFLTNHHVVYDTKGNHEIDHTKVVFNYEKDTEGNTKKYVIAKIKEIVNSNQSLDYALLKLDGDYNEDFGFLNFSPNQSFENDIITIIHHPDGKMKKISFEKITANSDVYMQYLADTDNGSSGSPVFNIDWEVVALHHAGGELPNLVDNKVIKINQGINISVIAKEIDQFIR